MRDLTIPAAVLPAARFVRVEGDHMEPTIYNGDCVAVVPMSDYRCEGLYLVQDAFGTPIIKRCERRIGQEDTITMWSDRVGSAEVTITREQFQDCVLGMVAAHVKVTMPQLLGAGL